MFEIRRYNPLIDQTAWNQFVATSKQGNFLFDRNYMDYHSDRFSDYSLMVYRRGKLYAVLPANAQGSVLYSHQGLTYGGLITNEHATAEDICSTFRCLNELLRAEGFHKVVYKAIPHIYHRLPAEEDLYALFNVSHAKLIERNISSTVCLRHPLKWFRDRHYGANKARTEGITITESDDLEAFWKILEANLMQTYGAKPVHSLQEMQLLKSRFPNQIRLFAAMLNGQMLGGTLVYIMPTVVHTQYISASPEGKHLHALDLLFRHLLEVEFVDWPNFDFGTSNEDHGRALNEGLIYQKEGFGGRGVTYDTYEWEL